MKRSILYIFGGCSTALEIAEAAALAHPDLDRRFVVGEKEATGGSDRIADEDLAEVLLKDQGDLLFILSQSNHQLRLACLKRALALGMRPFTVIHPRAWASPSAQMGEGVYLAAGASVSAQARVGDHSILNIGMVVGHDATCGSHFIGSPGCVLGGDVRIGERVFVGANSFVRQGLEVGNDSQVDAVTYVHMNIGSRKLCTNRNLTVVNRFDLR